MKCLEETCDNPSKIKGRCITHNWQFKKYGFTWETKTKRPNAVSINDGFSTARFCPKCQETVHWTKYHIELGMCAQCNRDALKDEKGPVVDTTTILNLIDAAQRKCRRKG